MTAPKIDTYFKKDIGESGDAEVTDNQSSKRMRSEGSSVGDSPSTKKTVLDADDTLNLPEDAPFWVPTLFKSIDRINLSIHMLNSKVDAFKTEVNTKLEDIKLSTDTKIQNLEDQYNEQAAKINELTESVKFVSDSFDEQKRINEELNSRLDLVERHNEIIKGRCKEYEDQFVEHFLRIDSLEQYGRRNCVLVHGIPEKKDEDTDVLFTETIQQHLNISIKPRDIDRTHRIGKPTEGKNRPIIAKFARYNKRRTVFLNKKAFKGSGFILTESLTRRRVDMLNAARTKFGKDNVWTTDGEVFTKIGKNIVNVKTL